MVHAPHTNAAVCRCGQTTIALAGEPIQSVICYCESCRTAARHFEQAPGAPAAVTADGGVAYCLYRKDRVTIAHGAHNLHEHHLKPHSPTRRVVATCCNAPMFADFTGGPWLTVFRDRLTGPTPEPQMRIMTKDRPQGPALPDGIPSYEGQAPRLMLKLLAAWAAMGFRRPKIVW